MRALLIDRPNSASIVDIPRPNPAPDEVLVRVDTAGICGSDVELLHGSRPAAYTRYPIIPGHEWAGTAAEVGSSVTGIAPGDRLVAEGIRACGVCAQCREGRTNLCEAEYAETGFTHPGAFAEYVTVPARLIHRLPATAPLDAAALLEPAACVATGLLETNPRPGQSVAVVGAGTLGLLAVALLALTSPARLAVFDVRPDRLDLARDLGGTESWNGSAADVPTGQFDLVFEAAGNPAAARLALDLGRRGGTVILEGIGGRGEPALDPDVIPLGQLRVQGIFGASSAAWRWVVDLFSRGMIDPGRLITHRYGLDEFATAFATLQDPASRAIKVQLIP